MSKTVFDYEIRKLNDSFFEKYNKKEYPEIEILWLARKKNELSFEVVSEEKADELSETGNYFITPIFTSNSLWN